MAVKRSKHFYEKKKLTVSDTTYQGRVWLDEGAWEPLVAEMLLWGKAKNGDLAMAQAFYNQHQEFMKREPRVNNLMATHGFTMREARAIVEWNDALLASAVTNIAEHQANWLKEREAAPRSRKAYYSRKIEKSKVLSICVGGKKLFREAQSCPVKMARWREKRLFMAMKGEGNKALSNTNIRLVHLFENRFEVRVRLGGKVIRVGETRLRLGAKQVIAAQENNLPITAQLLVVDGKVKIHVTPCVPLDTPPEALGGNAVGFDLNSGHFEATVNDELGNPLWTKSYDFTKASEIGSLLREVQEDLAPYEPQRVSVERLKGIQRKKASKAMGHKASPVRRAVSKLPTRVFYEGVRRLALRTDALFLAVSAAGTSEFTKEWVGDQFGPDTHHKSSFLICRRGQGYSIRRSNRASHPQWTMTNTLPPVEDTMPLVEDEAPDVDGTGTNPASDLEPG